MSASFTKVLAFLAKEFHDVRRQPRLLLSLIGGPLLVLGAFGATFRSANPFVRIVLVWPAEGIPGLSQEQAVRFIEANLTLVAVTNDEAEARQMLEDGQTDVIQIVPSLAGSALTDGGQPEIRWVSRAIDPNAEAWIRSLAYAEVNFINQKLLAAEAVRAQEEARQVSGTLDRAQASYLEFRAAINPETVGKALELTSQLNGFLTGLLTVLPPETFSEGSVSRELSDLYRDVRLVLDDLQELERALRQGDLAVQLERLSSTIDEIALLQQTIGAFVNVAPERITAPVRQSYTNERGSAYGLVVFFAPSVLALLIQQMAVTLASLGLVRERQMGAFEMFRVAPLSFTHLLLGKSLAYVLYVTFAGLILTGLMALLKVPMPWNWPQFLLLLFMLALASVGLGFLISAVSRTDSQAIQLTMLLLLLSVFFTGFFLPITGFAWPAWVIALIIPMTSGIQGFQSLMLAGTTAGGEYIILLGILAALFFGLVAIIMRRQIKTVID